MFRSNQTKRELKDRATSSLPLGRLWFVCLYRVTRKEECKWYNALIRGHNNQTILCVSQTDAIILRHLNILIFLNLTLLCHMANHECFWDRWPLKMIPGRSGVKHRKTTRRLVVF